MKTCFDISDVRLRQKKLLNKVSQHLLSIFTQPEKKHENHRQKIKLTNSCNLLYETKDWAVTPPPTPQKLQPWSHLIIDDVFFHWSIEL